MSTNGEYARAFFIELTAMIDGTVSQAERVWHEAVETATYAIVKGNEFGPGIPVDTGLARASFRIGLNTPEVDAAAPPTTLRSGAALSAPLDVNAIKQAVFGDTVFLTTFAEYAVYLEEGTYRGGTLQRRTSKQQLKKLKGTLGPTPFISPVASRWQAIVDEAVRRVGGSA